MTRRALVLVVTLFLALTSALLGASTASAATTQPTFLTFYGWWDNTPPGGDISYPQIHDTASGKGTYADPITFATSSDELKPGTKVWVPRVKKYFVMEDGCDECSDD
ncbi:carbohydrate-binding protein, partial [Amycolatopsis sp. NPDC051371]